MNNELISLADYLHAFQVVLGRLPQAAPDSPTGQRQAEARRLVQRLEASRSRLGIGAFEQAELARISGQCLPDRVIVWLNDCGRRLFAGEFDALAEDLVKLCRALEKLLYRPARCSLPGCRTAPATANSGHRSPLLPRREAAPADQPGEKGMNPKIPTLAQSGAAGNNRRGAPLRRTTGPTGSAGSANWPVDYRLGWMTTARQDWPTRRRAMGYRRPVAIFRWCYPASWPGVPGWGWRRSAIAPSGRKPATTAAGR